MRTASKISRVGNKTVSAKERRASKVNQKEVAERLLIKAHANIKLSS